MRRYIKTKRSALAEGIQLLDERLEKRGQTGKTGQTELTPIFSPNLGNGEAIITSGLQAGGAPLRFVQGWDFPDANTMNSCLSS